MPDIKVLLKAGESPEDADELLFKALKLKLNPEESWMDPAMTDAENVMMKAHAEMFSDMIQEINDALDDEFGGF